MSLGAVIRRHPVVWLAVALTLVRLAAAGTIHLTEDEAYYRLWALHLQFGYLDHPPMVAWWIRLGELAAGDTPLGVRLLPTLATGVTTWLIGDLARRLGGNERTAFRAALWYNATFTVALGGVLAIPDAPACFFWAVTLWCLGRRLQDGRNAWWLAAGVAAGLACLSKYSALFLAPGVILWLALSRDGRRQLLTPWPWLAAVVAVLVFAPNVVWNATHDWLTFHRQFGRVAAAGLKPKFLLDFVLTQLLLFNPLLVPYAAAGVRQAWLERAAAGAPRLLLPVATAAPFAVYLLLHSLHDRVQGHWPVPLFGSFALCAAFAAERLGGRISRTAAPALGLGLAALALAYLAVPSTLLGKHDPAAAVRGWPQFAARVEQLRRANAAAWVGTESYGLLSQLAAEPNIKAPLVETVERDRYPALPLAKPDFSRPGLVLDLNRRLNAAELGRCFAQVRPLGDMVREPGHNGRYGAYLVADPKVDVWRVGCPG